MRKSGARLLITALFFGVLIGCGGGMQDHVVPHVTVSCNGSMSSGSFTASCNPPGVTCSGTLTPSGTGTATCIPPGFTCSGSFTSASWSISCPGTSCSGSITPGGNVTGTCAIGPGAPSSAPSSPAPPPSPAPTFWTPTGSNWQCPSPPAGSFVGSYNPVTGWAGTCTLASGEICQGAAAPTGFSGRCLGGPPPSSGSSPAPSGSTPPTSTSSPGSGLTCSTLNPSSLGPSNICTSASTPPVGAPPPVPGGSAALTKITFYDQESSGTVTKDGLPPGGSGTYADPITLATDYSEIPDKTIVYVKGFNKYFIHIDECAQCTTEWASHLAHVDLWVGTDPATGVGLDPGMCANQWGVMQLPIIVNPPPTLTVSTQPMESASGQCFTLPNPLPTS